MKLHRLRVLTIVLLVLISSGTGVIGVALYQHHAFMKPLEQTSSGELTSLLRRHQSYKQRWNRLFPQVIRAQYDHYRAQVLHHFDRNAYSLMNQLNQRPVLPPQHWIKDQGVVSDLKEQIQLMHQQLRPRSKALC